MPSKLLKKAQQNLQKYWGYDSFLEGQQEAIQSVLGGNSTLVLFPTGGGKSLCYQIPATVFDGLTVVISPLIALMQDQVEQLNRQNVSATFINSTLSKRETEQRLVNARNGLYKLLYCSPERLDTELWKAQLPQLNISLIAIDEAHCISEWGHDFRPAYRNIYPALKSISDSTRWIALTATATPEVREDIVNNLHFFDEPEIISNGFKRPNLKWWVVSSAKKKKKLLQSVRRGAKTGSGIVYSDTRRNCEDIAELVANKLNIKTAAYHAGLNSAERSEIQEAWIDDRLPLVVATSAFGMGIDKADCRYVIHYQMPYSLEAYYQQAGRAGRDGALSYPILLYKNSDVHKAKERIENSSPNKKQLQKTYDVLCDTLNLAIGSAQDESAIISIDSLKSRSGLSYSVLRASLKTLQNLNVIEFREHHTAQAGIKFIRDLTFLQQRINEEQNHKKASFLDLLFRRLGPEAFDNFSYLKLSAIQQKLDLTRNGVIKGLQTLQNHDHLLKFELLGEQPMIRLIDRRVDKLQVNEKKLQEGQDRLLTKLDYMKGYAETDNCRELYLRRYFGEGINERCGHCDNCLRKREEGSEAVTNKDVEKIRKILDGASAPIKVIQKNLRWKRKKLKQVVHYLMREEKIEVDKGKIYWKK